MKKSDLKIMAMETCFLSELSTETKKRHLHYIKEVADAYQCIGYILDSKFYNLDESGKQELKERFLKEDAKTRKKVMSVAGIIFDPIDWVIYRTIRRFVDECSKRCGTYQLNLEKRQNCMKKCREEGTEKLNNLKKKIAKRRAAEKNKKKK